MLFALLPEQGDELCRRPFVGEGCALPGPLRAVSRLGRLHWSTQYRKPVSQTLCRAPSDCTRHHRVIRRIAGQRFTVASICIGLGASDKSRAELRGACTEALGRSDPDPVHDAASRNDRNVEPGSQKTHKSQGCETVIPAQERQKYEQEAIPAAQVTRVENNGPNIGVAQEPFWCALVRSFNADGPITLLGQDQGDCADASLPAGAAPALRGWLSVRL